MCYYPELKRFIMPCLGFSDVMFANDLILLNGSLVEIKGTELYLLYSDFTAQCLKPNLYSVTLPSTNEYEPNSKFK